jgi:hypothetical protein
MTLITHPNPTAFWELNVLRQSGHSHRPTRVGSLHPGATRVVARTAPEKPNRDSQQLLAAHSVQRQRREIRAGQQRQRHGR